jgi:predicted nuclease of predicted toxin-antitoxin system
LKPREAPHFFIDRCLGKNVIADALRNAGASVQIHDDHFAPDAPDQEWLQRVADRGWIVLTKDKRIRRRSVEIIAIRNAKAKVFCLTAGDLTAPEMSEIFVGALQKMLRFALGNKAPFLAKITAGGSVSFLLTPRELRWVK